MVVRLATIGLGGLGELGGELYAAMDGVEIVAGADVLEPTRDDFVATHQVPAYESYEELLAVHGDELDAVNIATPHTLHYEQAMACLRNDLHVFVEKPMVTDLTEGTDLVRTANERGLVLQVGYQRHFHPAFTEIKRLIDAGRIGEPHMVSAHLEQRWIGPFSDAWRANPELSGGGQLYDSGSHLIDSLLWTTGTEPVSVASVMDFRDHDVDVNSSVSALLEREETNATVTASIGVSGDGQYGAPEEALVVVGTDGKIGYSEDCGGEIRVDEADGRSYTTEITEDVSQRTLTRKKLDDFVGAIRGENEPAVPGEYGLKVTALTEAAYESHRTGNTVDVREKLAAAGADGRGRK